MTVARRLLLAGGGSGSFPATTYPPFALTTSAGGGGWPSGLTLPATFYNGVTYIGYIDELGNVAARSVTDLGVVSGQSNIHLAASWAEIDWHDSPSLLVRSSDHRIVAAACRHVGSDMYIKTSVNPEDIGSWDAGSNIGSTLLASGRAFTYPKLHELTSEGAIYLTFREHTDPDGSSGTSTELCYSKSLDNGATWSALTRLYRNTGKDSYWQVDDNGTDRIDFATTNGTGPAQEGSVYHFYMQGGSLYKTDGTLITASLPLSPADLTLVYTGVVNPARFVYDVAGNGGLPVITFPVTTSGDEDYVYASWNGAAWSHHTVRSAGATSSAFVEGGIALDRTNPTVCWIGAYDGSQWEIFRCSTADAGASWTSVQVTSGSAAPQFYPVVPRHHGGYVHCVWLNGTATSYTSYSLDLRAA